jgi:hypothetical protein
MKENLEHTLVQPPSILKNDVKTAREIKVVTRKSSLANNARDVIKERLEAEDLTIRAKGSTPSKRLQLLKPSFLDKNKLINIDYGTTGKSPVTAASVFSLGNYPVTAKNRVNTKELLTATHRFDF